ncbi:MAG: hypothetical protein KatS3mg114_1291 [Planctomycetaceae bacterium]|nr:MAG: hypothetical protein KatS3mg114_1291 [Planctomycetaceae bacterium]
MTMSEGASWVLRRRVIACFGMKRWLWGGVFLGCGMAQGLLAQETPRETAAPEAVFERLDQNGDGKLEGSEVGEGQRRFFERLLRVGDENRDGELSREEFLRALRETPEARPLIENRRGIPPAEGSPLERLRAMDRNGDGQLSSDEIPEPLRARLQPLFERLQRDAIPLEEASRFFERFREAGPAAMPPLGEIFERLDRNRDGKLSLEEIPPESPLRDLFRRAGREEFSREELLEWARQFFRERMNQRARDDRDRPDNPPRDREPPRGERREETRPERSPSPPEAARAERPDPAGPPPVFGPRRLPKLFRELDRNEDGRLSRDELQGLMERFGEFDEDKDGALDVREVIGPPPETFRPPMEGLPGGPRDVRREGDRPFPPRRAEVPPLGCSCPRRW